MDWDMYITEMGGRYTAIELDLDAGTPDDQAERPFLVRAAVTLLQKTEHGLAARAEDEDLNDLEDALEPAASDAAAQYVARVTRDGTRIFCFYASDPERLASALTASAADFPRYSLAIDSEHDAEWSFYNEFLYPARAEWQGIMNGRVLQLLRSQGDDLQGPRLIEHWANFPTPDARKQFAHAARELGLTVTSEPDTDRGHGVQLTHSMALVEAELNELTATLIELAEQAGGDYQGWETEAVSAPVRES